MSAFPNLVNGAYAVLYSTDSTKITASDTQILVNNGTTTVNVLVAPKP